MHAYDEILQREFYTIMAPKYGELEPCPMKRTRLLMGSGGLFIETRQPWGRLVKTVWPAPRRLPYGDVEEVDEFAPVLQTFEETILPGIIPDAARYACRDKEWAGWVTFSEQDGLVYQPLSLDVTEVRADYRQKQKIVGASLAVDVHSHGKGAPFFSPQDNEDDSGGVRICVVLGSYGRVMTSAGEVDKFDWVARYVVEGFFFDVPLEDYGNEALLS